LGGLGGAAATPSLMGHRMPPRITQKSCSPRVSDRTMVGILPSGSCLQGVRVERSSTAMKPAVTTTRSCCHRCEGACVSFPRHGEIFRNEGGRSAGQAWARPSPPHFDEFPVGYSLAGCSPAEPASASPTASYCAVTQGRRREPVRRNPVSTTQGWMPKKGAGTRPGRSVFFLTSPLIEPATESISDRLSGMTLSPFLPFSLSPFLPFSLSPFLPFSLSPFLPFSLSPFVPGFPVHLDFTHHTPVSRSTNNRTSFRLIAAG